jgi:hypothetical protein
LRREVRCGGHTDLVQLGSGSACFKVVQKGQLTLPSGEKTVRYLITLACSRVNGGGLTDHMMNGTLLLVLIVKLSA